MPLSSKKIIEFIKAQNSPVTTNFIIQQLVTSKDKDKVEKKNSRRKSRSSKPQKDIDKIHVTLSSLLSIGYLIKDKSKWKVRPGFRLSGNIRIDKKGKGELEVDGLLVQIKKEFVNNAHNKDEVSVELVDYRRGVFYGRVSKVNQRGQERYFAVVEKKTKGIIYYRLMDVNATILVCSNRFKDEPSIGQYVIVRVMGDKLLGGNPQCKIEKVITSNVENYDFERIVSKFKLPGSHRDYKFTEDIENHVSSKEKKNRVDYSNTLTVTIDGDHAKDYDDAISFTAKKNEYQLIVHIADVSAFVTVNSDLDKEARKRGTSYYLGDHVIPMLPEVLSNNFCSLREKQKRYTLSVEMNYDSNFNLKSYKFSRGIINVNKRLTYKIAQKLIEKPGISRIGRMLVKLNKFTKDLKKYRVSRGRVDLQLTDPEMIFNNGKFEDIVDSSRLDSHALIEECMLSANEVVSKILRERKMPSLYRVHEDMNAEKLYDLKKFFRNLGVKFKPKKNLGVAIQEIVNSMSGQEHEKVINFIILRSMMQAYYGNEPLGHFGLGFRDYTHFTSPIRRYPDLIVHRCLKALIDGEKGPYKMNELSMIGKESSDLERVAQKAERDLFKLKACRLLEKHIDEIKTGIISGVSKFGLYVTLNEKPIEGMVPLKNLTDDYYMVMESEYKATGRRHGKTYSLGDEVTVKILRSDPISMQIDFDIVR